MTNTQQIRPIVAIGVGVLFALVWTTPVHANEQLQTLTPPQAQKVQKNVSTASAGGAAAGASIKKTGTAKDDVLIGNAADNRIFGFRGDDLIKGRKGDDFISGGAGFDILRGNLGHDHLRGNGRRDKLFGGHGNDILEGGRGHDRMFGGKGNDRLIGGRGRDRMFGGPGDDTFVISLNEDSPNHIKDFTKGDVLAFQYNGDGSTVSYGNSPFGLMIRYGDAVFYLKDVTMTDLAKMGDWYKWEFAG